MMDHADNEISLIREEETFKEDLKDLKCRLIRLHEVLPGLKQCSQLHDLLQKLFEVRECLNKLEQGLLQSHLKCCISPGIKVPEEVVLAVSQLSAKRHGALIVIEQENNLDDYLEGGVGIDAAVGAPILENIFYPGSPLHDGAVIIRNNRIHRVGCMLPLAAQPSGLEALGLGTRHRAAVGLSQLSDALVIVVSEEKGWISLALRGQIYPNLGIFALLQRLGAIMEEEHR